jgi:vacuolar protein sorting-associated protein 13A/C
MNSKIDSTTPKTDAELLFKELGFVLDADQYRDVLSMIDLFHFYIRQRDYRPFRPALALLEENKSKALWKFALDAIQSEVHEKNKKWSWGYFAERRDDRKDYVRLFKAKHKKEISLDVSILRISEMYANSLLIDRDVYRTPGI